MKPILSLTRQRCLAPAVPSMLSSNRPLHSSRTVHRPYKDDQDRETLKPRSTENTKTGTDGGLADSAAAFDPSKTRPESTYKAAEPGHNDDTGNPLEASGANQELSKPMGDEKSSKGTGPGREVGKGGTSRKQSAPKKGKPGK